MKISTVTRLANGWCKNGSRVFQVWLSLLVLFRSPSPWAGGVINRWAKTFYGFVGVAWTLTTVWGIRGGITYLYARKHKQEIEKQEMKAVRPRHIGGVL